MTGQAIGGCCRGGAERPAAATLGTEQKRSRRALGEGEEDWGVQGRWWRSGGVVGAALSPPANHYAVVAAGGRRWRSQPRRG